MTTRNRKEHWKYIANETWKCGKSPTGAHWWEGTYSSPLFKCKFCDEERVLQNNPWGERPQVPAYRYKTGPKGADKFSRGASRRSYVCGLDGRVK